MGSIPLKNWESRQAVCNTQVYVSKQVQAEVCIVKEQCDNK